VSAVRLQPMTPADFHTWSRHSIEGFAAQQVAAGLATETEASSYAAHVFAETLPEGLDTPSHRFWTVRAGDDSLVGHLWLRIQERPDEVEAYVFDVEIVPRSRGTGRGRATMLAAEAEARRLGATVVRLNVFGHNTAALALYDGLGYTVTSATLTRRLVPHPTGQPGGHPLRAVGPPASRPRVSLRDLSPAEYDDARPALDAVAAGELDRLLPHGPATTGERLWTAEVDGSAVARVWVSLQHRPDGVHGLVRHLEVRPGLRRRGWGRCTLVAVGRAAQDLGVLTLTVSATSAATRRLFTVSGFELTAQTMRKAL
jgi:ribosomal protein S18 acetylase RimI-like enzyme